MNGNWWGIRDEIGSVRLDQKETPMSKSVLFSSVLLSGSLCFVGVQLGKDHSPIVESNPVSHVETVNTSGTTEPYIVEYDFTSAGPSGQYRTGYRVWSDGIIEARRWFWASSCGSNPPVESCGEWTVFPGSSEGYACRSDIDGDRLIDYDDLLMVISNWSQPAICNPHPDIECGKPPFQPPA